MNKPRKILASLVVVGALAALAGLAVFSAFSSTTQNDNNTFAAGSVTIGNNATAPLYTETAAKPGTTSPARCIKITYSGSLPANIKLYRSAFTGGTGLDTSLDLVVTKGTGDAENCSDFSGTTNVYSSTLGSLGTSFAAGSSVSLTNASASATWSQNDTVTYKFQASLASGVSNTANGKVTGTHSLIWEAQNT